jgi:hypothetical protein
MQTFQKLPSEHNKPVSRMGNVEFTKTATMKQVRFQLPEERVSDWCHDVGELNYRNIGQHATVAPPAPLLPSADDCALTPASNPVPVACSQQNLQKFRNEGNASANLTKSCVEEKSDEDFSADVLDLTVELRERARTSPEQAVCLQANAQIPSAAQAACSLGEEVRASPEQNVSLLASVCGRGKQARGSPEQDATLPVNAQIPSEVTQAAYGLSTTYIAQNLPEHRVEEFLEAWEYSARLAEEAIRLEELVNKDNDLRDARHTLKEFASVPQNQGAGAEVGSKLSTHNVMTGSVETKDLRYARNHWKSNYKTVTAMQIREEQPQSVQKPTQHSHQEIQQPSASSQFHAMQKQDQHHQHTSQQKPASAQQAVESCSWMEVTLPNRSEFASPAVDFSKPQNLKVKRRRRYSGLLGKISSTMRRCTAPDNSTIILDNLSHYVPQQQQQKMSMNSTEAVPNQSSAYPAANISSRMRSHSVDDNQLSGHNFGPQSCATDDVALTQQENYKSQTLLSQLEHHNHYHNGAVNCHPSQTSAGATNDTSSPQATVCNQRLQSVLDPTAPPPAVCSVQERQRRHSSSEVITHRSLGMTGTLDKTISQLSVSVCVSVCQSYPSHRFVSKLCVCLCVCVFVCNCFYVIFDCCFFMLSWSNSI